MFDEGEETAPTGPPGRHQDEQLRRRHEERRARQSGTDDMTAGPREGVCPVVPPPVRVGGEPDLPATAAIDICRFVGESRANRAIGIAKIRNVAAPSRPALPAATMTKPASVACFRIQTMRKQAIERVSDESCIVIIEKIGLAAARPTARVRRR
ncbi:hypothetical protein [Streptosporangium sp. NPDC049644]|uniref:hypothetical protein n=1 Tax=Streptosporangium sp. NPDC049644 TaxID=3155507 RepID=UPI003442DDEA